MKYDTEQMTFVGAAATAEESDALRLHYEIMAAAQAAAASLLDLARKIKLMRDTGGYKALGFDTLEAYTLATMTTEQMILNFYQNTARTVAQKWREKMFEAFAAGVRSGIFLLGVGVGLLGGLTAALVLGRAMIEACKALAHKL